ncbi:MAG TPA: CHAT domain-containing protein, partial [Fimbriimonadaceae bacterium]|nr:CHAT domain-containing protein [Fimbriimonadaceae bacterium]
MTREVYLRLVVEGERVLAVLGEPHGKELGSAPVSLGQVQAIVSQWRQWNQAPSSSEETLRCLAEALSGCLITESLGAILQELARSVMYDGILRIGVEYDHPTVGEIPWELLRISRKAASDPLDGYLVLQPQVGLWRRAAGVGHRQKAPDDSLRVLAIAADPGTPRFPRLAWLQAEVRSIEAAARRTARGRIGLKWLHDAVPPVAERSLREYRPHVVHFAGHGESRPSGGVLAFQGSTALSESLVRAS